MGRRGPHTTPIDWDMVSRLASLQCTQDEIAFVCKLSVDSLYNRAPKELKEKLSDYIKRHAQGGKVSLRRWQWRAAEIESSGKGSKTMLVWLGKQYLGQTENGLLSSNQGHPGESEKQEIEQLATWLTDLEKV